MTEIYRDEPPRIEKRPSYFGSLFRSFFLTIFWCIGIGLGLLVFIIGLSVFSLGSSGGTEDLELKNNLKILPDAEGKLKKLSKTDPVLLKINITGLIGDKVLDMSKIRTQLIESRLGELKDNRVKGILLNMKTPGGTVIDSDAIYLALKEYKAKYNVPIIAYIDGICASGGVYVSSAADQIYSSDVSIIGSVGVLLPTFMNFSQALEKLGIQTHTIYAGKNKDDMNPLRPWKEGESENYQTLTDYYYNHFVSIVTASRPKLTKEQLINDLGARIFPAAQALELGFIDGIVSSPNEALKVLVKAAGLEGKNYQYMQMEERFWYSSLFNSDSPLLTGKVTHEVALTSELPKELVNQYLFLYRPE